MTIKGPKGEAHVSRERGHLWQVAFWPTWIRGRKPPKTWIETGLSRRVAEIRARQLTGAPFTPERER